MAAAKIVLSMLFGGFEILFLYLYESLVLKQRRQRSKLEKQGIRGPPSSSIIFGNIPDMKRFKLDVMKKSTAAEPSSSPISKDHRVSINHEWHSTLFPHLVQWRNEYGPIFVYSTGIIQHGILSSDGPIWSHQRKIIAPEFYSDKVKLNMLIQETLRLYPPAVFVVRQAFDDIELNNIVIPKETNIQIPVPILQQWPEICSSDALEFNPKRFEHGILGAYKYPQVYMPFGFGPRICFGQHFAVTELKVILSLILSKFCFSLSPAYKHRPVFRLVIENME